MAIAVPTRSPASLGSVKSDAVAATNEPTELLADQYNVCADKLIEVITQSNSNESSIATNAASIGSLDTRVSALEAAPGGGGDLLSDGSVPMAAPYVPGADQDIATKKYADDAAASTPPVFGTNGSSLPFGPYNYNNLTSGDPALGELRMDNNVAASLVREIRIHRNDARGLEHEEMLQSLLTGDSIVLARQDNYDETARFTVDGPAVDSGAFVTIPISITGDESTAGFSFSNGVVDIQIIRRSPIPGSGEFIAAGQVSTDGVGGINVTAIGIGSSGSAGNAVQLLFDTTEPDSAYVVTLTGTLGQPVFPVLSARTNASIQIESWLSSTGVALDPLTNAIAFDFIVTRYV